MDKKAVESLLELMVLLNLLVREQRHRKDKELVQGHAASVWLGLH